MGALIRVLGGDTRSFSDTPIAALYFLLKHVKEHLVARARQSLGAIFFLSQRFSILSCRHQLPPRDAHWRFIL